MTGLHTSAAGTSREAPDQFGARNVDAAGYGLHNIARWVTKNCIMHNNYTLLVVRVLTVLKRYLLSDQLREKRYSPGLSRTTQTRLKRVGGKPLLLPYQDKRGVYNLYGSASYAV